MWQNSMPSNRRFCRPFVLKNGRARHRFALGSRAGQPAAPVEIRSVLTLLGHDGQASILGDN
jgi:hypothetical protein